VVEAVPVAVSVVVGEAVPVPVAVGVLVSVVVDVPDSDAVVLAEMVEVTVGVGVPVPVPVPVPVRDGVLESVAVVLAEMVEVGEVVGVPVPVPDLEGVAVLEGVLDSDGVELADTVEVVVAELLIDNERVDEGELVRVPVPEPVPVIVLVCVCVPVLVPVSVQVGVFDDVPEGEGDGAMQTEKVVGGSRLKGGVEAPETNVPEKPSIESAFCVYQGSPVALNIFLHVMSLIPTMPVVDKLISAWRPEQLPPVDKLIEKVGSTWANTSTAFHNDMVTVGRMSRLAESPLTCTPYESGTNVGGEEVNCRIICRFGESRVLYTAPKAALA